MTNLKIDVRLAIEKYLDLNQIPSQQSPFALTGCMLQLLKLKDDDGERKYPEFLKKSGYVVALIKHELGNMRKQKNREERRKKIVL